MGTLLITCIALTSILWILSHLFMNAESKFIAYSKIMVIPLGLISIFIASIDSNIGLWGFLIAAIFLLVTFDGFRQGIIQNILVRKSYPISEHKEWYKLSINQARELPFALTEDDEKKLKDEIAKRKSDWDPDYY